MIALKPFPLIIFNKRNWSYFQLVGNSTLKLNVSTYVNISALLVDLINNLANRLTLYKRMQLKIACTF